MNTKKLLALLLACIFVTFSLVSCTNKEYVAEIEALKEELAALRENVARLENPPQELLDQLDELSNNIDALEPKGKEFTATVSEYRNTVTSLTASSNEAFAKEIIAEIENKIEDSSETTNYVAIRVKDYGTIVVELFPNTAPITVKNFKKLVSEDFYDGLIFHRVIKDFMIQGGDPKGNGTGGSKETIKGEFSSNGVINNLSHTRGVISMARSQSNNSASSQFFICHADSPHLDGNYAAFGKVVYGIEVVDLIASVRTNTSDKPLDAVVISSIDFVTLKEG